MLSRSSRWNARDVEQDPNMFLPLALGMWNPFLASTLGGNAQAYEGFGLIAREWQAFAARRLKEDFALVQRLTHGRTPDQILAAYTEFWWKAADDYGNAFATATKLMTGVTTKMVMAAQSATEEAGSRNVFGTREAA